MGSHHKDPSGRFEVEVGEGTFYLVAMARGFAASKSAKLSIEAGEELDGVAIDLLPGGSVQGVVVGADTGRPIANATISLHLEREESHHLVRRLIDFHEWRTSVLVHSTNSLFVHSVFEVNVPTVS